MIGVLVGLILGLVLIELRDRRESRIRAEIQLAADRARVAPAMHKAMGVRTDPRFAHDMPLIDQVRLGAVNNLLFIQRQQIKVSA